MGVERNQPCPCGSGRKYKNCCGRLQNKSREQLEREKARDAEIEKLQKMSPEQRHRYEIKKKRDENNKLEALEIEKVGDAEIVKRDMELMHIELKALKQSVEIDRKMLKENLALLDETYKKVEALPFSLRKKMVLESYEMQRQGIIDKIDGTIVFEQNRVMLRMLEHEK